MVYYTVCGKWVEWLAGSPGWLVWTAARREGLQEGGGRGAEPIIASRLAGQRVAGAARAMRSRVRCGTMPSMRSMSIS
jgi:hypothetical protein